MELLIDHAMPLGAALSLLLAALAWWGDRRRARRADLDRVGLTPWTGLFFWAVLAAAILLAASLQLWLARG